MSILFLAILNRKKNFYTVKKILTGSGACNRRHQMRKPPLQMTSFCYLAITIDNLYIHELLGYMRCLFFKAVTESFIFFRVFFFLFVCLVGFYFIATLLRSFNRLQNHLKLYNFDHDFEVRWKFFRELFFSYFKIIITFTLLRTGPPYIKRKGTKRRETD